MNISKIFQGCAAFIVFHRSLGLSSTAVVVILFPINSKYEFNVVDSPNLIKNILCN